MNRKIIKAAIDAIILLRNAQNENVPSAASNQGSNAENVGKVVDVPINGGGPDELLRPGLTNDQIFGKLMPTLYMAGNADPIGKIISIANQQAKSLGYDPDNMTPQQSERLAASLEPELKKYFNSFGDIWSYLNVGDL